MEQKEVAFTVGDNSPSHLGDEDSYLSKDSNPTKVPAKAIWWSCPRMDGILDVFLCSRYCPFFKIYRRFHCRYASNRRS